MERVLVDTTHTTACQRRRPRIAIKQPVRCPHDHRDVMVTAAGRLRCAPLLLVATRRLLPGWQPPRRHAGIDIVTVMLSGTIVHVDEQRRHTLGPEDVAVRWTGRGIEHAVIAAEPATLLELWLPGRADVEAGYARYVQPRVERVEQWSTLASAGDAIVRAIVLPVGATTAHRSRERSYLLSTLGRVVVDGHPVAPDARVTVHGSGGVRITALESTEVVAVTLR